MRTAEITARELPDFLRSYRLTDAPGGPDHLAVVFVDVDEAAAEPDMQNCVSAPVVVVGVSQEPDASFPSADLIVGDDAVDALAGRIERTPLASLTLIGLLRAVPDLAVEHAVALESALYSSLQAGPEFARWRESRPAAPVVDTEPPVLVVRVGDELTITLNRPARHNAISSSLRDGLSEALELATLDASIDPVVLRGAGPSFCSGGDLDEFGSRSDPVSAHLIRSANNPSLQIHRIRDRVRVHLHGAAVGGGIEMAAFAGRVVVTPDTVIGLPELDLGLIPGAGGTVSVTRRIGRQRTAALALGGLQIDGRTAVEWGLADELHIVS